MCEIQLRTTAMNAWAGIEHSAVEAGGQYSLLTSWNYNLSDGILLFIQNVILQEICFIFQIKYIVLFRLI